ncbi:MAG: hypothetical protein H0V17_16670 [Deltaproteobacteria bacterium]|nr:hypothetical protein [Deltaproteobacteria bacterium]
MSFPSGVPETHRPWRYMFLAAGVAAVFGMFLPLIEIKHKPVTLGFTAVELSFGMDTTRALAVKELPRLLDRKLKRVRSAQEDLQLVLEASKWAILAFAPGILLFVFGAIGLLRKRVGRVLGVLAFLLGLGSIGAWIGLRMGLAYAAEEVEMGTVAVALQVGAHSLLVIGGLGVLAGLGALFQPDRISSSSDPMPRQSA